MKYFIPSLIFILLLSLSSFKEDNTLFPTMLQITVLDENGNIQKGARITLYAYEKYYKAKKPIIAGPIKTNDKGRVLIKKLQPINYYIRVRKGQKDNANGVHKLKKLKKGKINKVNIIISYF